MISNFETGAGRVTLRASVEEFITTLQDRFPERARRLPAALKKGTLFLLRVLMPPHRISIRSPIEPLRWADYRGIVEILAVASFFSPDTSREPGTAH